MKDLPQPGDLLSGRYRIDAVAGEGAMGIVYAAHHLMLDQRVALKVMHPESARHVNLIERFVREARAAARIVSPHVARVYDAGVLDSGLPFFAMELLEGVDLAEVIEQNGAQKIEVVADWLLQALVALAQAHALGVVHRDLKPANLFLSSQPDGSLILKIVDFGISKVSNDEGKALTGRQVLGTPMYMSPEQLQSAADIDYRSDLYSLGVVAFELATGALPFTGDGMGELFGAILAAENVSLRALVPSLPKEFEDVVLRAMHGNRERRFQTAAEFARAVAPFASPRERVLADRIAEMPAASTLVVPTPSGSFKIAIPPSVRDLLAASSSGNVLPGSRSSGNLPAPSSGNVLPATRSSGRLPTSVGGITTVPEAFSSAPILVEQVATDDTEPFVLLPPRSNSEHVAAVGFAPTVLPSAPSGAPSAPLAFGDGGDRSRSDSFAFLGTKVRLLPKRVLVASAIVGMVGISLISIALARSLRTADATTPPYEAVPPSASEIPAASVAVAVATAPPPSASVAPEPESPTEGAPPAAVASQSKPVVGRATPRAGADAPIGKAKRPAFLKKQD